jgi:uncharacterized membrane protein YkvA (DUF1232 family)
VAAHVGHAAIPPVAGSIDHDWSDDALADLDRFAAFLQEQSPEPTIRERLRGWARQIKRDVHALNLAAGDPRVPWYAKVAAIAVAAYALSPIDLIPDFIPVVGYLDDLVLVPVGILLAVKLVPPDLMVEFRRAVASADAERVLGKWGAAVIVMLWVIGLILAAMWLQSVMGL